jgi:TPR repeat protein
MTSARFLKVVGKVKDMRDRNFKRFGISCALFPTFSRSRRYFGQYYYGCCLLRGTGVSTDLKSAARYFKLSADKGDWDAQCYYADCLHDGTGISIDMKSAAHYFKLSADHGHSSAQVRYGICLVDGTGISTNLTLAAHYFKLSADQGNADG